MFESDKLVESDVLLSKDPKLIRKIAGQGFEILEGYSPYKSPLLSIMQMGDLGSQYSLASLFDIDGNGQEELVLHLDSNGVVRFEIWGLINGAPQLLLSDKIIHLSGAPMMSISMIEHHNEVFLCVCAQNSSGDVPSKRNKTIKLYTVSIQQSGLTYHYTAKIISEYDTVIDEAYYLDGRKIDKEEFEEIETKAKNGIIIKPPFYMPDSAGHKVIDLVSMLAPSKR